MTTRLQLRFVAPSSISSRASSRRNHVTKSHTSAQESLKGVNLAGHYGQNLGKHTETSTRRHESLHQHTSRRHKRVQATCAATRFSCMTMAYLFYRHDRTHVLAMAVRRVVPVYPASHRRWNRAPGESHSFATIVSQQAPVPKSIPAYVPTKPRVIVDRAADVMRGRGVPLLPQQYREAKAHAERKIREAEAIRLQKIGEAEEQEARRFLQQLERIALSVKALESQMASVGWPTPLSVNVFINALLNETRLHARFMLVEQRSHQIALMILEEFSDVEMSSAPYSLREVQENLVRAREQRLNARRLRIEEQCRLIALAVVRERHENAQTSSAMPLPHLLDKLNADREHRWTGLLQEILKQKEVGQPHDKFRIAERAADASLRAVLGAVDETLKAELPGLEDRGFLGKVMKLERLSKPIAGLVFVLQSLKQTYVSNDAHIVRSWNRVVLRNKLAPEIFAFDIRSTLLDTKLAETENLAQQIWTIARALRKETSFDRYNFIDERMRILTDLLRSKANAAKEIGWWISGFRLPFRNGANDVPHLHHRELLEAELARVSVPIIRLAGLGNLKEIAGKIVDNDSFLYERYRIHDSLANFRRELGRFVDTAAVMRRQLHGCIVEIIFWRGMQLQYQSQWGQASFPRPSHQLRTDIISSVDPRAATLSQLARNEVERHTNRKIDHSHTAKMSLTGGPAISYVTTAKFAHTVLEEFRSSSILGLDILSFPRLDRVPSISHRSQIQALVLASENHIAIFHIALFEAWDAELMHIPALKEILESKHALKVGVNMNLHAQCLKNHTTVDMDNFVDLNRYDTRHNVKRKTTENEGERARSDDLSELTAKYYGTQLPSLRNPGDITNAGLISASYIQYLASRSYAALKLYSVLERTGSGQESAISRSLDPQVPGRFNILARYSGRITIDPYWREEARESFNNYEAARLKIRTKVFSRVARSREFCLNAIVDDLATTFIDDHLRARTKRERVREKAKIEGRRQDLKAMYLRIFFYERPEDILAGQLPAYSALRVLQIAKQHEIDVPPDRKLELEAESPTDHSDPRERAETWLKSILKSGTSDVLIVSASEIRSIRQRLLREYHRDVLLLFAVWQVTPTSDDEMASWFFTSVEQVRSDILLVKSLNLLHPVKHKLERLLALKQQKFSSSLDGSFPHQPSFKATSQISSRIEVFKTAKAADEVAVVRSANPAYSADRQRRSTAADLRRLKEAAAAAARERRTEREREKRKAPKASKSAALKNLKPASTSASHAPSTQPNLTRDTVQTSSATEWGRKWRERRKELRGIQNRVRLRVDEADRGISLSDSPTPLNINERRAIKFGLSLRDWFVQKGRRAWKMAEEHGLPPPSDIDLLPTTETMEADTSAFSMTLEELALRNASAQSRRRPQPQATVKASPGSGSGSGRRRLVIIRAP